MKINEHYEIIKERISSLLVNRAGRFKENEIYNYQNETRQLKRAIEILDDASDKNRALHITTATYDPNVFGWFNKNEQQPGQYDKVLSYMIFADIDILEKNQNIDDPITKLALQNAINHIIDGLGKYIDNQAIYSLYSGGGAYVIVDPKIFEDFFMSDENDGLEKHILIETFNLLLSEIWDSVPDDITNHVKLDIINSNFRWMKVPFGIHKKHDLVVTPLRNNKLQSFETYQLENWHKYYDISEFDWFLKSDIEYSKTTGLNDFIISAKKKVEGKIDLDNSIINLPGRLNKQDSNLVINVMIDNDLFPELIKTLLQKDFGSNSRAYGILSSFLSSLGMDIEVINNFIKSNKGKTDSYIVKNYSKLYCPSYYTIYESYEGFPKLGLKDFKDQLPERPPFKNMIDETLAKLETYMTDGVYYEQTSMMWVKWNIEKQYVTICVNDIPVSFKYDTIPFLDMPKKIKTLLEFFDDYENLGNILQLRYREQKIMKGFKYKIEEIIKTKNLKILEFKAQKVIADNPDLMKYFSERCNHNIAGEVQAIRLSLLAKGISTILRQVIYIMFIANSNNGKDAVNDATNLVIPEEYIKVAASLSISALFRLAKDNPHYFNGMLLDMGDMGSKSEQEKIEVLVRAANRSTDGGRIQSHIVNEKDRDGNWQPMEFRVSQFPSINTSSVHYYQDAQITSRTIAITLENDSDAFWDYKEQIHMKNFTPITYEDCIEYQDVWKYLRTVVESYDGVINPYTDIIRKKLSGSQTEKRLAAILDHCFMMYAIFRFTQRQTITRNGKTYLVIGRDDIRDTFKDLAPVEETMMHGVSHNFKRFLDCTNREREAIKIELLARLQGNVDIANENGWKNKEQKYSDLYDMVYAAPDGTYFTKKQIVELVFDNSQKFYDEIESWRNHHLIEALGPIETFVNGKNPLLYKLVPIKTVTFTDEDYEKCEQKLQLQDY